MSKLSLTSVMRKLMSEIVALKKEVNDEGDDLLEYLLELLQNTYPKEFNEIMKELS